MKNVINIINDHVHVLLNGDFDLPIMLFSCIMNAFFLDRTVHSKKREVKTKYGEEGARQKGIRRKRSMAVVATLSRLLSQLVSNRHSEYVPSVGGRCQAALLSPHQLFLQQAFIIGAQSSASENRNTLRAIRECAATHAAVKIERGAIIIIDHLIARFGAQIRMRSVASQG